MRNHAPLWLMGLTYSSFGMYGGLVAVSAPQLMAARHVPESTIATISAVILSPGFWGFLFSPILDVKFTRRWYSVSTAVVASMLLVLALVSLNHLLVFESLLTAGFFCICLYQSALGGWLASIVRTEDENRLSIWVNVGNICAGGAMAIVASELMRIVSLTNAALILGGVILAPTLVFPWMPAPASEISGARGSLAQFLRDLAILLRRRDMLLALMLFVAPTATFSLTNFLAGVGHDFEASPRFVGLVGGAGVLIGGVCGCLAFPLIDRLLPLRSLYLSIGIVGALFTLGLILLPHTAIAFAIALIGQNVFQALAFTASTAIQFDAIGRSNPLSATAWCLMVSAYNIPISYMLLVDGWGYNRHGVTGSFLADGTASLLACLLLATCLLLSRRRASGASGLLRVAVRGVDPIGPNSSEV
jgi:MFS transporter, PAT family, beta-lactamase induction signal transducer AmpG